MITCFDAFIVIFVLVLQTRICDDARLLELGLLSDDVTGVLQLSGQLGDDGMQLDNSFFVLLTLAGPVFRHLVVGRTSLGRVVVLAEIFEAGFVLNRSHYVF